MLQLQLRQMNLLLNLRPQLQLQLRNLLLLLPKLLLQMLRNLLLLLPLPTLLNRFPQQKHQPTLH